jgi:hypothetical protein
MKNYKMPQFNRRAQKITKKCSFERYRVNEQGILRYDTTLVSGKNQKYGV